MADAGCHVQNRARQALTAERRELHSTSCDQPQRERRRKAVCVCVTAAFCCTADNLVNQLYLVSTVGKKELKIPQATE